MASTLTAATRPSARWDTVATVRFRVAGPPAPYGRSMGVQGQGIECVPGAPDNCVKMRHRLLKRAVIEKPPFDRRQGR